MCILTEISTGTAKRLKLQWLESMDELLLFSFTNLMHELFQVYRTSLFPFFDTLFGVFMSFLESETAAHKKCALCVFDDVLEFTAHEAERYYVQFAPALLQCLQDEDAEVRQVLSIFLFRSDIRMSIFVWLASFLFLMLISFSLWFFFFLVCRNLLFRSNRLLRTAAE
eukprot:m.276775 g.276775  ORF g.276775 m.276775 type:complete len:168 (+) comp54859_c0_seq44:320-823(+)